MTHDDAMQFLNTRLNYESRGMPPEVELRVDRTAMLLEALGRPHDDYPIIHIAGTKGKGSTSVMVAELLQEGGWRVGLHTSPHLISIEERFQIGGVRIDPHEFAHLLAELRPAIEDVDRRLAGQAPLTFFEITTALALWHFSRQEVDCAVIEVGMGGRLDSTNVVDPAVSVITTISLDHTRQLGTTLSAIASEKAGIIKRNRPLVCAVMEEEAQRVIHARARELSAPVRQLGADFHAHCQPHGLSGGSVHVQTWRRDWGMLRVRSPGSHQCQNAATALAVMDVLTDTLHPRPNAITGKSLAHLNIPGRIQIASRRPCVVLDVAHNPASIRALVDTLMSSIPADYRGKKVLIFASSRDKDWRAMLRPLFGFFDEFVVTRFDSNPRSAPVDEIASFLQQQSIHAVVTSDTRLAWHEAAALLNGNRQPLDVANVVEGPELLEVDEDLLCVTGSFYLIADLAGR